jgi:hypothetical protein
LASPITRRKDTSGFIGDPRPPNRVVGKNIAIADLISCIDIDAHLRPPALDGVPRPQDSATPTAPYQESGYVDIASSQRANLFPVNPDHIDPERVVCCPLSWIASSLDLLGRRQERLSIGNGNSLYENDNCSYLKIKPHRKKRPTCLTNTLAERAGRILTTASMAKIVRHLTKPEIRINTVSQCK